MSKYIEIIKNNPTQGGADGAVIGEGAGIISGMIDLITKPESDPIKLAIRTAVIDGKNYIVKGESAIHAGPADAKNIDKITFALDSNGAPGIWQTWGAELKLPVGIDNKNCCFWVKFRTVAGEDIINDKSVSIYHKCADIAQV